MGLPGLVSNVGCRGSGGGWEFSGESSFSRLGIGLPSLVANDCYRGSGVKGNVVRTNVYHKYIKDLKLNITIDLDGFIYYPSS